MVNLTRHRKKQCPSNKILALAGLAVEEHYLVELKEKHKDSFEGKEIRIGTFMRNLSY